MSEAIKLIIPEKNHLGIYTRIWNTTDETMKNHKEANICIGCSHQIMLFEKDYKKIVSKLSTKHRRVYYHGEPCHICGKVCGKHLLEGESLPK